MEINIYKQKEYIQFSDIDLAMNINPFKKDLNLSINETAIKRAIKNLVFTGHYERPFHPEIGCNITKMLFELNTSLAANFLEEEIFNLITNFEPRVQLTNISVEWDTYYENGYNVTIQFYMVGSTTPMTMDLFLKRLR